MISLGSRRLRDFSTAGRAHEDHGVAGGL